MAVLAAAMSVSRISAAFRPIYLPSTVIQLPESQQIRRSSKFLLTSSPSFFPKTSQVCIQKSADLQSVSCLRNPGRKRPSVTSVKAMAPGADQADTASGKVSPRLMLVSDLDNTMVSLRYIAYMIGGLRHHSACRKASLACQMWTGEERHATLWTHSGADCHDRSDWMPEESRFATSSWISEHLPQWGVQEEQFPKVHWS